MRQRRRRGGSSRHPSSSEEGSPSMSLFDHLVVSALPFVPKTVVGIVARRYIAGETADEALATATELNGQGFLTTLDMLGEDIASMEKAQEAANTYGFLLEEIQRRGIETNISLKPTQFGLRLDKNACRDLIRWLIEKAQGHNNFVRIEMEDSTCTTDTIDLYRSLRSDFDNTGIVLQAYLRRTKNDVARIGGIPPNVRIVKGVYVEPRKIAYKDPRIINKNYIHLAKTLLKQGAYVAFATHDELLVWEAFQLVEGLGLPPADYEFQMLLGVEKQLRDVIRDAGHRIRVYIPFGPEWYPYSVRRLRENPKIAGYVMRAMLQRQ